MSWPKSYIWWVDGHVGFVSVPFTWNLPEVRQLVTQGHMFVDEWHVGGPACRLMPDYLAGIQGVYVNARLMGPVLNRFNPQATRTTIGCPRGCKFCGVSKIEPEWRELDDWPDLPILCDNNITAASHEHFDRVMDKLERHKAPDFNQGIDCRILTEHHAERLGRHRGIIVRLALDSPSEYDAWEEAWRKLRKYKTAKSRIRSYVLCAFNSGVDDAWERCQWVERHGALALPMWYHPLDSLEHNAVTDAQMERGWSRDKQKHIMGYYYQHRGEPL